MGGSARCKPNLWDNPSTLRVFSTQINCCLQLVCRNYRASSRDWTTAWSRVNKMNIYWSSVLGFHDSCFVVHSQPFMFLVAGHLLWYSKKFELLSPNRNLLRAYKLIPLCQKITLTLKGIKNHLEKYNLFILPQIQYKILKTSELYNKYNWIDDWQFYSKAYYLQCWSSCSLKDHNGLIFWSPARITAAVRKCSACSSVTGTVEERRRRKGTGWWNNTQCITIILSCYRHCELLR